MVQCFQMTKVRNWKKLFYRSILSRGESYYKYGYVYDYTDDGSRLFGHVGKDGNYDVEIDYDEDGDPRAMSCDCPFAASGQRCKHMAALLYKNNAQSDSRNENKLPLSRNKSYTRKKIYPFDNQFSDEHFFRFDKALKYDIYDDDYNKALQLIEKGQVVLSEVQVDYSDYGQIRLTATCDFEAGFVVSITYYRGEDLRTECYADKCYRDHLSRGYYYFNRNKTYCVHEITALILLKDYILNNNPGDYSNAAAIAFLKRYRLNDEVKEISDVMLEPRIDAGYDHLFLSLRAGGEKLFVIRHLSDFIEAYENRRIYEFSSKSKADFNIHRIRQEDQNLYDFLRESINDEYEHHKYEKENNYYVSEDVSSKIPLYGKRLDRFYDLYKEHNILVNDESGRKNRKYAVGFKDGEVKLSFTLSDYQNNNRFEGLRLKGSFPKTYRGLDHDYVLDESYFVRVPKIEGKNDFLSDNSNSFDMIIGRKHLPQFYNTILPELKEKYEVKEKYSTDIFNNLPVKPLFSFYLDVREGIIYCLAEVKYNDETYNIANIPPVIKNRDYFAEDIVKETIKTYFNENYEDHLYIADTDDEINIIRILDDGVPSLMKLGEVHTTDSFDRLGKKKHFHFDLGVRVENNLLELDIQSEDIPLDELTQVINSYRQKKRYHKLKDGQLIRIDDEDLDYLNMMMEELGISLKDFVKGKLHLPTYRALYLNKLLDENEAIYDKRDEHFRSLIKDLENINEENYVIPEKQNEIMRPYQKDGYRWLKTLSRFGFGGILADEMGLGKTLQMLTILQNYKDENGQISALIVCPSSLVYNWLAEVRKFTPDLSALAITGSKKERQRLIESYKDYDLLITSYDLLKRDIEFYEDKVFDFEILDEAQYIKTHTTNNAKSCKIIKASHRFALTGTPIENNLSELWSIFDYLMPGFLYRLEEFRNTFENRIIVNKDEKASKRLKEMIAPFILRRRKADVLKDLPDKIEETIKVRFENKQRKLYDSEVIKISKLIKDTSEKSFKQSKIQILAELTKIRQICCEPSLLFENYDGDSVKRKATMELIRNAVDEGHKILLFSQFTSMLEIIEEDLKKEKISYYKITGQTKKEERLELVNKFNSDDTPIFLISLKAGGTGLNLTGADIVIHYDPWWNVAAQNQATDRAHRIGQQKAVSVYKIIVEDSIEEKIVEMQERKSELVEDMLSSEGSSLSKMSKEDLLDLLT